MTVDRWFNFDGQRIEFRHGSTIGAALAAAGIKAWRTTRKEGRPRGLFCGMGVCYDCLITVNGRSSLRACLVAAQPNDVVTTQRGTGHDDVSC